MQIPLINRAGFPAQNIDKADGSNDLFINILSDAVENANNSEAADVSQTAKLMSGEGNDLHAAMITMEKADLAMQFTVQIRNKIIEAYNEVMRMQI